MTAAEPPPTSHRSDVPESVWFWDHYDTAAKQVIEFIEGEGIRLEGRTIADIGCGDGIIDLGLVHKGNPAVLTGFDVNPTDTGHLLRRATEEGACTELPANLEFRGSDPTHIPADTHTYDIVVTWSAFEHIAEPVSVLGEAHRIMRPDGLLFLQLWPFYHSSAGSHLWDWFSDPFPNLTRHEDEVVEEMRANPKPTAEWTEYMLNEYRHLNRVTLDELQRCILAAGMAVRKFEIISHPVHVAPALQRYPLSQLGIAGVKLIATPL
jgi:ubiquinone/menaquinone biosynthesis C-methylase UbiE